MAGKRAALVFAAVGVIGLMMFNAGESILSAIGDFLVVQDKLQPVDVIHVVAGPDEYTDYAVQLYQQGFGKKIFFTGGWCPFHNVMHGEHGRERAVANGVSPEAIAGDDSPVTSTYSEVVRLKVFIEGNEMPIRSVAVVSDPYHMRRARWTYRQILGNKMDLRMAPLPFELSQYKRRWWTDKESKRMVKDEYLKILYYYARYKFAWAWMKDWLESLDRD
jgi:uncharacterized SAM-binding protein YcdF (DUF218 family)